MSEEEFIEDNIDGIMYNSIPITANSFKGLWLLNTLFTRQHKERKTKKQEQGEVEKSEQLVMPPEKKLEIITI